MSGGAGGGRGGGDDPEVTSGQAKVTRFGAAGETLAERQDGWRETNNGLWRTTDDLMAVGGRPLRGGSAAWAS